MRFKDRSDIKGRKQLILDLQSESKDLQRNHKDRENLQSVQTIKITNFVEIKEYPQETELDLGITQVLKLGKEIREKERGQWKDSKSTFLST